MRCMHCEGPGLDSAENQCCWIKALEVKRFRKKVLHKYLLEVILEMIISISSVVTDIISLIIYIKRSKWVFAILTALPVLLPTTVYANVYLSDENQDDSSISNNKTSEQAEITELEGANINCVQDKENNSATTLRQSTKCLNFRLCCRGFLHAIFHTDKSIRKSSKKLVRKHIQRATKYFFGTIVLRFIAWSWYLKAIIFGWKALKCPKRYMKVTPPDQHWSYELLVRLDFLQAALENAPQCTVQLYALVTDSGEDRNIALLTLGLSFLDFLRVTTTVLWNIQKGPVLALPGCYGSFIWKMINMTSWISIYLSRCFALALVFATSETIGTIVASLALLFHMLLFGKIFSSKKLGVVAKKIIVTTFISIFFLPDLDSTEVDILIQFYYATIMLENTFFIIPWSGFGYKACDSSSNIGNRNNNSTLSNYTSNHPVSDVRHVTTVRPGNGISCVLDPSIAAIIIPSLTVLGMILRFAAAKKMAHFKATHPEQDPTVKMEEKVANIYNRKWMKISTRELMSAFLRMLRKEVTPNEPTPGILSNPSFPNSGYSNGRMSISEQFAQELQISQEFIRKSFSVMIRSQESDSAIQDDESIRESKPLTFPRIKDKTIQNSTPETSQHNVERDPSLTAVFIETERL